MKINTLNAKETEKIGFLLSKKSNFFALRGDLGSGKTTFLKGVARGLKIKEDILSPTFVIFKKYKIEGGFFYHLDAYRVDEKDLLELSFLEIIKDSNSIIAAEWSENIEKILPKKRIDITFRFITPKKRELIIKGISAKMKDVLRARSSAG